MLDFEGARGPFQLRQPVIFCFHGTHLRVTGLTSDTVEMGVLGSFFQPSHMSVLLAAPSLSGSHLQSGHTEPS
jgi:hypothetical protein